MLIHITFIFIYRYIFLYLYLKKKNVNEDKAISYSRHQFDDFQMACYENRDFSQ